MCTSGVLEVHVYCTHCTLIDQQCDVVMLYRLITLSSPTQGLCKLCKAIILQEPRLHGNQWEFYHCIGMRVGLCCKSKIRQR